MLNLSQFEYLSFDCYGTLIDWETGILGYLSPLLASKGVGASNDEILNLYSEVEPRQQQRAYRTYREILAAVVRGFAARFHFEVTNDEAAGLAHSIRDWQPFADTVPALRELQRHCRLAVLSNIDDDLFALTAPKLGVELDLVVTAQQAGSYKPSLRNFGMLLERLPATTDKLLHVAESLYHDVVPASALGIATVWVNRRQGKPAAATRLVAAEADLEVATVAALAEMVAKAHGRG